MSGGQLALFDGQPQPAPRPRRLTWTSPDCACRPGWRCPPCTCVSRASQRMFRLCRLWGPDARRDRVAYADQVTSMCDARAALCLAIGIGVDQIHPVTGHDQRSTCR